MKTIKQEEPITRSRFIDCPQCKTRGLKLKRIVQAGRCRNCHESYKIVIMYVKTGKKEKEQAPGRTDTFETKETPTESTLPSWETPSDNSLFGTSTDTSSTFSDLDFGMEGTNQEDSSAQEST